MCVECTFLCVCVKVCLCVNKCKWRMQAVRPRMHAVRPRQAGPASAQAVCRQLSCLLPAAAAVEYLVQPPLRLLRIPQRQHLEPPPPRVQHKCLCLLLLLLPLWLVPISWCLPIFWPASSKQPGDCIRHRRHSERQPRLSVECCCQGGKALLRLACCRRLLHSCLLRAAAASWKRQQHEVTTWAGLPV